MKGLFKVKIVEMNFDTIYEDSVSSSSKRINFSIVFCDTVSGISVNISFCV